MKPGQIAHCWYQLMNSLCAFGWDFGPDGAPGDNPQAFTNTFQFILTDHPGTYWAAMLDSMRTEWAPLPDLEATGEKGSYLDPGLWIPFVRGTALTVARQHFGESRQLDGATPQPLFRPADSSIRVDVTSGLAAIGLVVLPGFPFPAFTPQWLTRGHYTEALRAQAQQEQARGPRTGERGHN